MRNEGNSRGDSREHIGGVIDQGESLGPISEVSLENTVDTESKRLEQKVGVFAATLASSPEKKKSFMDRLRERSSWRSVMALLVGLHLNSGRHHEMPEKTASAASSSDHESYKEGMKELFEIELPVSAEETLDFSAESDNGFQEYAPHYEAQKTASVEKEVQQLKEFIQKNAFKKYKIRIQGSSSFEGDSAKNETLSSQRANIAFAEILSQLEKDGIDTQNIEWEVSGVGENIKIDEKQVSEVEAYEYLQKELGVHSKKEVDKKIEAFNDGKFAHPALEKLLTQMRGHQVSIEGIGELPAKTSEKMTFELEYPPEEDSSVSSSVDSFSSDFHDAILRLRREDEIDGTKPETITGGPPKKPKPPLPGRTPRSIPQNSPADPPKDPLKFSTPPRTSLPPRPPRISREPGPRSPVSPEPLPRTPEPIPVTPKPLSPEPTPRPVRFTSPRPSPIRPISPRPPRVVREPGPRPPISPEPLPRTPEPIPVTPKPLSPEPTPRPVRFTSPRPSPIRPISPRPPRVVREPGPRPPISPEPLPPTPEPIPPTPEPQPPQPPPRKVLKITRIPQGKRKEIQSMRVHRMDKEDRDERFYKKQPLHGSKSRTGREAVVLDTSGNAELLPKMIHDEKDFSRGSAKKDRSDKARRESIDRRKTRDLLGRNETSE